MPDSPLFPWQSSEDSPKLTQEIKDPLSPARIELPRHEGLLLNEVLFAQWAAKTYSFFGEGLSSDPQVVTDLIDFCHRFLCLRLQLADWVKDDLAFDDKPLTATESLSIPLPDGSSKAAPLYLLYMIYGFFVEEQAAWLGKPQSRMMETIRNAVAPLSGEKSIGDSSDTTPAIQDSPEKHSDDAPSKSSKAHLKAPKKQTLAA